MKVAFVASEVVPFSKTGGLADVAGALPAALQKLGAEVLIVTPGYRGTKKVDAAPVPVKLRIPLGKDGIEPTVRRAGHVYFIDYDPFFDRDGLYGTSTGDYKDNAARFVFFCRAAMELLKQTGVPDVLHAHDWQAALATVYAKTLYRDAFERAKTVFTIHNLAYQGLFWHWDMALTGLDWKHFHWRELEYYGKINFLKGALVHADALTTVSPTYAREIQTQELGCGLDGVLRERSRAIRGILNGIDTDEWNPETDPHIAANYTARAFSGKAKCKAALQKQCGLPAKKTVPVIGMIGRLAEQKGIDLFVPAAEELLGLDVQIVILGSGEARYQEPLLALAKQFPEKLSVTIKFDPAFAHQIEAGSDLFLMPSRYEPCGLNQMYSMRYGTVPVVRSTGGLADTVTPETGFSFAEYEPEALVGAVRAALAAFADAKAWKRLAVTGMKQDFSWDRSAKEYLGLYESLARG